MSEEDVVVEESANIAQTAEETASQQGWKPQEEWEGNPEDWVDAKEFNRRGEYMERIKSQSSLIKKLEKKLGRQEDTLKELSEHHRQVKETEYKRALNDLKNMKREALEYGDHEKVVDIDDKINDLKMSKPQSSKPVENDVPVEVEEWMDSNPWYSEDLALQGAANALLKQEFDKNPDDRDIRGRLDKVTKYLKEEFPSKFGRKVTQTMPVAEPGTGESKKSSAKYSARHLNEVEKKVAKRYIEMGAVKSYEEYAQQLADIGELSYLNK